MDSAACASSEKGLPSTSELSRCHWTGQFAGKLGRNHRPRICQQVGWIIKIEKIADQHVRTVRAGQQKIAALRAKVGLEQPELTGNRQLAAIDGLQHLLRPALVGHRQ